MFRGCSSRGRQAALVLAANLLFGSSCRQTPAVFDLQTGDTIDDTEILVHRDDTEEAGLDTRTVKQILHEELVGENPTRYSKIIAKVQPAGDDQPRRILVHLMLRESYEYETAMLLLDENSTVTAVEYEPDIQPQSKATSTPVCPDNNVQFVFSAVDDERAASYIPINELYDLALARGYRAAKLLGHEENIFNVKGWLACPNVIAYGRIGHGSSAGIVVDDGSITSSYFAALPPTYLNDKVIFFNSCNVHNDPLEPAIVSAGVQKFIGGDKRLTIGASESIFLSFWTTLLNNPSASISQTLTDSVIAVYGRNVHFGISGNGSDYLSLPNGSTVGRPPQAPRLQSAQGRDGTIALSWGAVSNVEGHIIRWGTAPGIYGESQYVGSATSHLLPGLQNGVQYYIVVQAYNQHGESSYSNELQAAPQAPVRQARLSGTLSVNGEPLSHTQLTLRINDVVFGSTQTTATGAYSFDDVIPGRIDVAMDISP